MTWVDRLAADPLPWLLDGESPAVRHRALRELLDRPAGGRDVVAARRAAMAADPIATILDAQDPEGWWIKPGGGYSPKYTGTVWTLVFLDQLGADGADPRIRRGCEYLLAHTQASNGGFGWSGGKAVPAPSTVAHLPERQPAARPHRLRLAGRRAGAALDRMAGGRDHRRG